MKKLSIILSIVLCLSLISGCTVDITVRDENGSSIPTSEIESFINNVISNSSTTTTTENAESSSTSAENTSASTSSSITVSTTKETDKSSASKPSSSSLNHSSVTSNNTSSSTSANKTATTANKKDHGTPNINGTFHDDMAQAVLTMLNQARKAEGLGELTMDNGNMMKGAKIRAKEITIHWAHERPDGESWNTIFNEEGIKYNARGENLADGYTTAQEVFDGWMASPGHKANIMEPRFTHISIACLEYEGHFYWVQLFGANVR